MIQKRFKGTFDMFLLKIKPVTEIPCRYTKKTLYKSEIEQEWHPLPENPLETLLNHLDTQPLHYNIIKIFNSALTFFYTDIC